MTDIQMTAEPPAAPVQAPEAEIVDVPNPIRDEPHPAPEPKPEPKTEKPSLRETLEKAASKVEAADKGDEKAVEKSTDKTEVKADKPRDETGKFAPKAAEPDKEGEAAKAETAAKPAPELDKSVPHNEAPARFSSEAKEKWASVEEPVRAEVHRAIKELEAGHAKYKQEATDYQPFKPFHELAKSLNVDAAKALHEYVSIDKLLGEDFVAGLERICTNKGVSLREVAAHIMGQPVDQQQAQSSAEVRSLKQEIAGLRQQLQQVAGTVSSTVTDKIHSDVAAFAASPDHAHFDELSEQIAAHIANDGLSLQQAYDKALSDAQALAQRLGFIPKTQTAAPAVPDVDLEAQTQKGQKSIAGAPSAGSAPATQKPSPTIRDAIRKAVASANV